MLETMAGEMPGYATARVLLARSYEGLGEWSSALDAWRDALHIVPNSPVVLRGVERTARKVASSTPSGPATDELPSMSVSTPAPAAVESIDVEIEPTPDEATEPAATDPEADDPEAERSAEPEIVDPEADDVADPVAQISEDVADAGADVPLPDEEPEAFELPPAKGADEDLDRLIAELESARIMPRPDLDTLPEPDLEDDIEDVVSVTLARIYASQGQYGEAARVYELLAGQQPENEEEFKTKAAEMRSKASEE